MLTLLKPFLPYIAVAIVAFSTGFGGAWKVQGLRITSVEQAFTEFKQEQVRIYQEAQDAATVKEESWRERFNFEQSRANEEIRKRDAAYVGAIDTITGLRNTINTLSDTLPENTSTTCTQRISALSSVFGECVERYTEMGRNAQGHFVDAVTCREAWPK